MIPKARFDEGVGKERDRAEKAERDAAYWRGVAEARQHPSGAAPAPGQQPPPAQTPEQRLAEIHTAIDALAKKFDDGEITMTDFKRQERELASQEQAIREEGLLSKVKPTAATPQASDDLYLDQLTVALETDHPWVGVAEEVGSKADWDYVQQRAIQNLVDRGVDPSKGGNIGRYELRKEVAVVWDELGPGLLSKRATDKGITLPDSSSPPAQPQPQQPKPPSQAALSRQAKLGLHAQAPPNVPGMTGTPVGTPGQYTDAQVESFSDDDYDKLPAAVRNKLKGIAP